MVAIGYTFSQFEYSHEHWKGAYIAKKEYIRFTMDINAQKRVKKCQEDIGDFLDVAKEGSLSEKEIVAMLQDPIQFLTGGSFERYFTFENAEKMEYLVSKWRLWYKWFDINKDGKVDFADAEHERSKFSKLHHLSDDEKKTVMDLFGKWWTEYVLWGKSEMTESDFIDLMSDAWKTDKAKFVERMQTCMDMICNIVDTNNDGDISLEEFNIIMKSSGHNDKSLDEKFFENYKPVDGKVPIKVISDSWVHFVTCEDSTKPDLVKAAFEFGV